MLLWSRWVDNHLVHVLSPNIYRSSSEALESFDYITSNGKILEVAFNFMHYYTIIYCIYFLIHSRSGLFPLPKGVLYMVPALWLCWALVYWISCFIYKKFSVQWFVKEVIWWLYPSPYWKPKAIHLRH